jgi:hypothetical protein
MYEDSDESAKSGSVEICVKIFLVIIDSFEGV